MSASTRLLIVGAEDGSNIGGSLYRAAQKLGAEVLMCDTAAAWRINTFAQRAAWHFWGRRPLYLSAFSQSVLRACREFEPTAILTTGRAPLTSAVLTQCRRLGIRLLNFSTDDPFNPAMRSPWFLRGLRLYDIVFTPRRANVSELRAFGCADVRYMPFGYDEELFYREAEGEAAGSGDDLFFAGHVERSRMDYVSAALAMRFTIRLYGSGWDRYASTRRCARGEADIPTIRREATLCKLALCVVRHDNRDGHSMRTFELAAVGACMLVEDTPEHRQIFGAAGDNVAYFSSPAEMLHKAATLVTDASRRRQMRDAVYDLIVQGRNTYADRLRAMLQSHGDNRTPDAST